MPRASDAAARPLAAPRRRRRQRRADDAEPSSSAPRSAGPYLCSFSTKQANAGQSVARHNAILKTTAEHVVVIDDDMEVCPEFLAEHLAASRKAPGKAIVIGKVVPEERFMRKPSSPPCRSTTCGSCTSDSSAASRPAPARSSYRTCPSRGRSTSASAGSTPPCGSTRTPPNRGPHGAGGRRLRLRAARVGHPPLRRGVVREVGAPPLRVRQVRRTGLGEAREEPPHAPSAELRRRQPHAAAPSA